MSFVKQGTPEWNTIWEALERNGARRSNPCKECEEDWEYMGPAVSGGGHVFRHRCGRGHNKRRYVEVA